MQTNYSIYGLNPQKTIVDNPQIAGVRIIAYSELKINVDLTRDDTYIETRRAGENYRPAPSPFRGVLGWGC